MEKKIEYIMFDGTTKTEIKEEDQKNVKEILVHHFFYTTKEVTAFKEKWEKNMDSPKILRDNDLKTINN